MNGGRVSKRPRRRPNATIIIKMWIFHISHSPPSRRCRGKFGTVFLARDTKDKSEEYAAKFVTCPKKQNRQNLEREIDIMTKLQHPRLIQIMDAFHDGVTYCLVLEL